MSQRLWLAGLIAGDAYDIVSIGWLADIHRKEEKEAQWRAKDKIRELERELEQERANKVVISYEPVDNDSLTDMMLDQRRMYDLNGMPNIDYTQPLGHRAKQVITEGIGDFCKSAMHECAELENWTAWKPWSKQLGNKWQGEQWSAEHLREMRMEVVDLFCFVLNLCCLLGMDAKTLWSMYKEKRAINQERHDSGRY